MRVHRCHECSYQTERMYNLKVHQKRKHKNVKSYGLPMEIDNAGVVNQQNYLLPGPATVNQFNIPPHQQPVNQPNAQSVYHQTGYLSDVGTQTSDEKEEPDILKLLKDTETNFNDLQAIKKNT